MPTPDPKTGMRGRAREARNLRLAGIRVALILFCLVGGPDPSADTILLRNGSRIANVETWEEGGLVKCLRFGSVIGYPRSEVLAVLPGPVAPATAEAPFPREASPEKAPNSLPSGSIAPSLPDLRMKHLFDGDSFKASDGNLTLHIRIAGIDAPERGGGKKGAPGQPYSRAAADHLRGLLSNRPIRIQGYGMDSYNRLLAEVFAEGRNVGLDMVEAGYAEVYSGRLPEGFNAGPYRAAMDRARKYGRGMWAQGRMYVSPRQWRNSSRR